MDAKYKFFLIGLGIGIILLVVMYVVTSIKHMKGKKELVETIKRLKSSLNDKMELESEGITKLKEENEKLKKENENFRISLSVALQKHEPREIARAQVLQTAIDKLLLTSPGFGTAWAAALKEAEEEGEKVYSGKVPFFKRIFSPSIRSKEEPVLVENKSEEEP